MRGRKGCLEATINHSYRSDPCGKKHKAQSDEDHKKEQRRNARKIHEGDLPVAMARWLRVFENMNRGVASRESRVATIIEALACPCSPSNAKGCGQLHLPYLAFFIPPISPRSPIFRAACPSSHQSEVAHPAFCHKPQTSDAIQFATFRETGPSLLLFGPRRSACRHHMSIRFLDPMRLNPQDRGIEDRHANRRKNTMDGICAA